LSIRSRSLTTDQAGYVAVALSAVVAHATALGGGYVWLDHAHLEEGLALAPPGEWPALFTRGFAGTGFYRPLMALSLSIDAVISKTPLWFHTVTLAWHALAAVLVASAGRCLGVARGAALLAAVIFAVHPVTALVANATAFRSEAMLSVFLLGLVVAHVRERALPASALVLAGALTKETAWLFAPLLLAVLELTRTRDRALVAELVKRRRLLGAELAAFAVASALHFLFAPAFRALPPALSFDQALGTRLAALAKSARTLLFPFEHELCDAFAVTSLSSTQALGGLVILAGLLLLVWKERRLGWLFALALLPSLQIVPVMRWWSPHYLYLPLAFGSLLLASAALRFGQPAFRGLAFACVPLCVLSLVAGSRYANDSTLWAPEVQRQAACREGQYYLGEVARSAGDLRTASTRYALALRANPRFLAFVDEGAALQNLGVVLLSLGEFQKAGGALSEALARSEDPEQRRRLAHNLATVALGAGNAAEAARLLEPETRRHDALPESLLVRARALHQLDREAEALELLRRLERAPNASLTTADSKAAR
jgi:tetratricopeptide (TPR) repeat protein